MMILWFDFMGKETKYFVSSYTSVGTTWTLTGLGLRKTLCCPSLSDIFCATDKELTKNGFWCIDLSNLTFCSHWQTYWDDIANVQISFDCCIIFKLKSSYFHRTISLFNCVQMEIAVDPQWYVLLILNFFYFVIDT